MMFPFTITYTSDVWRFMWRPTESNTVYIGHVEAESWSHQMDAPDTVNLGRTDALGMHPDLPFMRVLDNFRKAADEWVAQWDEEDSL